jgi:hypothetical protein
MKLKYLTTNGKLKASSVFTYAFNLPAVQTCPGAGVCKAYCFAASEQKRYPSAMAFRQRNLELSQSKDFVATIAQEIKAIKALHAKRGTNFAIRIHASGDFYSPSYIKAWFAIMAIFPNVCFYAYTKSIALFKKINFGAVPPNFSLIFSLGSNQDSLVDLNVDRHAKIFATKAEALQAGYTLADEDDAQAWLQPNHKIGLVIFGATKIFKEKTKDFSKDADKSDRTKQQEVA